MRNLTRLAALAVTALAGLALTAAPALASPHPIAALTAPNTYQTYNSGYTAHGGGFHFVNVTRTFKVPLTDATGPNGTAFSIETQLSTGGQVADLQVRAAGADTYVAEYGLGPKNAPSFTAIPIAVIHGGDSVTLTEHYNQVANTLLFTVVDHSNSATSGGIPATPTWPASANAPYASVLEHMCFPAADCATDLHLAQFVYSTGVHFSTRNGTTGNLNGPFPVGLVIRTDDGFQSGDRFSYPNPPRNRGREFGDWHRP